MILVCTVAASGATLVEWWKQYKRINFPFILIVRAYFWARPNVCLLINAHAKIFDRIKFSNNRKIVFSSVFLYVCVCVCTSTRMYDVSFSHSCTRQIHTRKIAKKWITTPLRVRTNYEQQLMAYHYAKPVFYCSFFNRRKSEYYGKCVYFILEKREFTGAEREKRE